MRQTLGFRRRQLMPRPLDGLWDLTKIHEVTERRRNPYWWEIQPVRYWVDPDRWLHYETPWVP